MSPLYRILPFAAFTLIACSSGQFMDLRSSCNRSDCYTLQRGITKEQFLGQQGRIADSSQEFRLGNDVWEVWVYNFDIPNKVSRPADVIPGEGDPFGSSRHQEYVAFKNGRLEEWGWGTLPRALRDNPHKIAV